MDYSRILVSTFIAVALLTLCATAAVDPLFDIQQISLDVNNASAVRDLLSRLRPELLPPPKALPPKLMPGFSPTRKGLLDTRQSCTGNQNNYCFGNTQSYCASCGLCCIQAAGGWCCPSSGFICCPAATVNGGSGCCPDWQLCQSSGCVDPSYVSLIIWTFSDQKDRRRRNH
jgi:hypothetical protein